MKRHLFPTVVIFAIVIGLLGASLSFAASNASYDPSTILYTSSYADIQFTFTPDTDDGVGMDYLMAVCYDASGNPQDSDRVDRSVSSVPFTRWHNCDYGYMSFPSATAVTWRLYDISTTLPDNSIGDLPAIEASPLLACYGQDCPVPAAAVEMGILPILDGRLNAFDHGAPVALYCADGVYNLWDIGTDGQGTWVGSVSVEDVEAGLAAAKDSGANVEIASLGDNSLWALAPGDKLQLMGTDLREAGKQYVFIFTPRCSAAASREG